MIKVVPTWVWFAAMGVCVAVSATVSGIYFYDKGQDSVQNKWDKALERGRKIVAELEEKANKVNIQIQEKVVYRDRIIEKKGQDRVVVREVFVPRDSGMLGGGFRLYHDAAATNTVPDSSRISNAAPVPVTDVADTIDANYQLCHKAYSRLDAWNNWWQENEALFKKANADLIACAR